MMKNIFNKISAMLLLMIATVISAQTPPPPPPSPQSGGVGSVSQPIDMYILFLVIIAIALIIFYARKLNFHKI